MSQSLISHSADLKRLRDEGYEVEISASNYLLIHNVPYVNSQTEIARGTLASTLSLAGNKTAPPDTHVAFFTGDHPCHQDGSAIISIQHAQSNEALAPGLHAKHAFSNKPSGGYPNYHAKMTRYIDVISHPAASIDPTVTARTFKPIGSNEEDSVFAYLDTASSRVGIGEVTDKLKAQKVGIIGLGGTGSYILDLVAKTPVKEIHLFDKDNFLQHNAFRSPGAPSLDELAKTQKKVDYLRTIYSKMHTRIVAHDYHIGASNVDELSHLGFVFMCLDKGKAKQFIVAKLEELRIPFIDVGMGVQLIDESKSLIGILRITTSTEKQRGHVKNRISYEDDDGDDDYSRNIQIADLNALNAALAVVKWKKLCGFYQDLEEECHSTYTINVNMLLSENRLNGARNATEA